MNRTLTLALVAAALCAVTTPTATAAALPAPAATVRHDDPDDGDWEYYGDFHNQVLCEAAGAAGVVAGRWDEWRCDGGDLWVDYDDHDDDFPNS
ncbi:hypothetical protein [Saccharothrix variisporea]|uniref:Secreted protein n=1 Tax=Saccharothrix variisporea TaxID=543527 RepID=A0A495WZA4_9PSEU|nr:hypothetical protein [Saccharothrix variisporea]RKT67191.1 hypothetical protein DFJ66_0359 [Saccharothrix variisporea]